ncbi:hypothetical protein [Candidatus Leptofilum sp.]|uniref:hypothetical protein n=1 Tax=Candidatus Leptofilum sp. TaxID=3241576 RepID=UPI003B5C6F5E
MKGENKNTAVKPNTRHDDLSVIEGLGKQSEKGLNEAGIYRFADLARFKAPTDLHNFLLEKGVASIPLERIENEKGEKGNWVHQARQLVQQVEDKPRQPKAETAVPNPTKEEWQEHAHFDLVFEFKLDKDGQKIWRTYIVHEQGYNDDPLDYRGIEDTAVWVNWILYQANLPGIAQRLPTIAQEHSPPKAETPPAKALKEIKLNIIEADVDLAEPDPKQNDKQLIAKVRFQLTGTECEEDESLPLKFEIRAVDLASEEAITIASTTEQIKPQLFTGTGEHQFAMPSVGHYELRSQVTLTVADKNVTAEHKGPRFKVNP